MAYEMTGTVKVVLDEQTFASGFNKREFVLTVEDGKYPQEICFETVKEKTSLCDDLNVGDKVTVSFDIRGREYNGRYFNNLSAWKIAKGGGNENEGGGSAAAGEPAGGGGPDHEDDIPF